MNAGDDDVELVKSHHLCSILDENLALKKRVALQASLIQHLLACEKGGQGQCSAVDGCKSDAGHASPVSSDVAECEDCHASSELFDAIEEFATTGHLCIASAGHASAALFDAEESSLSSVAGNATPVQFDAGHASPVLNDPKSACMQFRLDADDDDVDVQ
eukprot:3476355-Karenia_brevis.AAC.1